MSEGDNSAETQAKNILAVFLYPYYNKRYIPADLSEMIDNFPDRLYDKARTQHIFSYLSVDTKNLFRQFSC